MTILELLEQANYHLTFCLEANIAQARMRVYYAHALLSKGWPIDADVSHLIRHYHTVDAIPKFQKSNIKTDEKLV